MADAYKGVNEANRIVNKDGNSIDGSHAIRFNGNNPVVSSTESITNNLGYSYPTQATTKDALVDELKIDASKNTTSIELLNG